MSFDLLIKNGTVVDGTGGPSYQADVGVAAGKIAEVGKKLTGKAQKTIDASNLIVSPGFIDPHTHYDAQICWDAQVSSSSWNGVTTALMGNCRQRMSSSSCLRLRSGGSAITGPPALPARTDAAR